MTIEENLPEMSGLYHPYVPVSESIDIQSTHKVLSYWIIMVISNLSGYLQVHGLERLRYNYLFCSSNSFFNLAISASF